MLSLVTLLCSLSFVDAAVHWSRNCHLQSARTTTSTHYWQQQHNSRHRLATTTAVVTSRCCPPPNKCISCSDLNEFGRSIVLDLRGGAGKKEVNDGDEEDEDDDSVFDLDATIDDVDVAESDFAEDNTLDRMLEAWRKTPPLTKAFLQASVFTTLYGYLFNGNNFPELLTLEWKPILFKLQIWRLFTSFLNFGPMGFGYLMTAHFVWTYMSTLERLSYNKPYDFWIMILFGQLSMVIGYPLLKLSPRFLGHNLSTFMVYIWSRSHEGMEVNLFELFNARAELLPWFFLAQTFLLEGELPVLDFLGIAFGHVYHHCKTIGLLRAPPALVEWYTHGTSALATRIRKQYREISSDFEMI